MMMLECLDGIDKVPDLDHNPYAPPAAALEAAAPLPEARSLVPRVFGILSIIFSSVFALLITTVIVVSDVAPRPTPARPTRVTVKPVLTHPEPPPARPPTGAVLCVGFAILGGTVSLLFIGIGQVRYRRWAVRGTLIWSAASGGLLVAGGVWMALVTPAEAFSLIPSTVLLLPYPVLLLVFFGRSRVVDSMVR